MTEPVLTREMPKARVGCHPVSLALEVHLGRPAKWTAVGHESCSRYGVERRIRPSD